MSERKYEHTLDMAELVRRAAQYEKIVEIGQDFANDGDYGEALSTATDALEAAQIMFYMLLPADLREEFWDLLDKSLAEDLVSSESNDS